MVAVGDYVQHRYLGTRGEIVKRDSDGWCVVFTHNGYAEFLEENEKNLIRILKREECDSFVSE